MTLARDHRKHIPIGVKLHACLLLLGFSDDEIAGGIQWNHKPALALRVVDEETGELTPHPNDPRYLEPLRTADHLRITTGRRPGAERTATTAGSDIGNAAKVKRLERARMQREASAVASDDIDRVGRIRAGDDCERYPTIIEKHERRAKRKSRPWGKKRPKPPARSLGYEEKRR